VSQISPPIRILLVAAIVLMAAYFTVLKPKEEVVAPVTPVATPAVPESTAGKFKAKAEDGRAKAEADATGAANAGIDDEAATTGAPATSTSSPSTTAPAAARVVDLPPLAADATAGLPAPVRAALRDRDVLVLGVVDDAAQRWAPMADDDRLLQRELRNVDRVRGEVVVRTVSLRNISRYDGLIKDLGVTQSPTVVVVDGNRRGIALTGYVDRVSINQAVADARRVSEQRRISQTFLRRTNETCANMDTTFTRLSEPTVRGATGRWAARLGSAQRRYGRAFRRIPAPKQWRSLKKGIVAGVRAGEVRLAAAVKAKDVARVRAAVASPQDRPLAGAGLERRFNAAGLTACSAKRPI
jgi:hypothetical protein